MEVSHKCCSSLIYSLINIKSSDSQQCRISVSENTVQKAIPHIKLFTRTFCYGSSNASIWLVFIANATVPHPIIIFNYWQYTKWQCFWLILYCFTTVKVIKLQLYWWSLKNISFTSGKYHLGGGAPSWSLIKVTCKMLLVNSCVWLSCCNSLNIKSSMYLFTEQF